MGCGGVNRVLKRFPSIQVHAPPPPTHSEPRSAINGPPSVWSSPKGVKCVLLTRSATKLTTPPAGLGTDSVCVLAAESFAFRSSGVAKAVGRVGGEVKDRNKPCAMGENEGVQCEVRKKQLVVRVEFPRFSPRSKCTPFRPYPRAIGDPTQGHREDLYGPQLTLYVHSSQGGANLSHTR